MKKTTFKAFCLCLLVTSVTFAQTNKKQSISKSTSTITQEKQNKSLNELTYNDLTEESKRSLEETGKVRCASIEMDNWRRKNNPNIQTKEEFENWLAPLIKARKIKVAQEKANGTFKMAVTTIPIIFHVITDGTGATNLSAAQIQAQIDQLNLDFSNGAGSTHPAAADAMVQFIPALRDPAGNDLAEPGIDRVTTYGGGTQTSAYYDSTIKPNTIWDRGTYANIWTGNLGGGLLGYAQFPSNSTLPGMNANGGASTTDGVVCLYTSIGSVANPHPDGGVYAAGRTLTHEIGHWIGLRHIWGDANCGDDYCADTPESTTSNSGCPTQTTCDGVQDMVENYMDYTYDTCMDIFTADQVGRIATVIANADGFDTLQNSNVGVPLSPVISFQNTTMQNNENTDCTFTDIVLPVVIGLGPSATATANLSVTGGTATSGVDFDLMTSSLNFGAGAVATQNATLRVYNDGFVEGDETVVINFTVNANGGDAAAGNNTLTYTIIDNDLVPVSTQDVTLLNSDFEAADTTAWYVIDNDADTNVFLGLNGLTYTGIDGGFIGSESDGGALNNGGNFKPDNFLISDPIIVPDGTTNVNFGFSVGGYQDNEPYEVYWTTDDTDVGTITGGTLVASGNTLNGDGEILSIDLTSINNETGFLAFRHVSTGNGPAGSSGIFLLDNISITATIPAFIQTAVNNGTTNDQLNLSGAGTVYTNDSSSGNVMLDITNNNTFDYGCTTSAVFRAGTGAQAYSGSTAPNLAMDKVFNIKPSNATTTGNTTVKFYFELAEITGWEAATGQTRNDLVAYKEGTGDIVALTVGAFGTDITLTGNFSGLDGNYYFGTTATFAKVSVSPVVFLQGAFTNPNVGEETLMRDDLRVGGLIPTTSTYADGLTCNASVFTPTGANAIVDWVWVELRDAGDNSVVIASQSALLQRDGDVVGVDGVSPLVFDETTGNYFVVVSHRSHLGIMSAATVALSGSNTVVDLSANSASVLGTTNAVVNMTGVFALVAGDFDENSQIQNTDINSVILLLGGAGYNKADVDMNGQIQNSDINAILYPNLGKGQQF